MINGRLRDFWHSSAINMEAAFGIQVLTGRARGVAADAGSHLGLMNFRATVNSLWVERAFLIKLQVRDMQMTLEQKLN